MNNNIRFMSLHELRSKIFTNRTISQAFYFTFAGLTVMIVWLQSPVAALLAPFSLILGLQFSIKQDIYSLRMEIKAKNDK